MSSMTELQSRLSAVKQTKQITNAMYLLSASRMKKATQYMDFNLLYLRRLRGTMKDIISKAKHNDIYHRFIHEQGEGRSLFIAVTADKGLCGGYNSETVNRTLEEMKKCDGAMLLSVGSVGSEMFISRGVAPDYAWYDVLNHPSVYVSGQITDTVINLYIKHKIKTVYVVYNSFQSSSVQMVECKRILPLLRRDFLDLEYEYEYTAQPIFEPSVEKAFDCIVPQYVTGFMYNIFMQASASENAARMNAMQNATDNADEMIEELSAQINAERQLAITNEIIEIAAASEIPGAV